MAFRNGKLFCGVATSGWVDGWMDDTHSYKTYYFESHMCLSLFLPTPNFTHFPCCQDWCYTYCCYTTQWITVHVLYTYCPVHIILHCCVFAFYVVL